MGPSLNTAIRALSVVLLVHGDRRPGRVKRESAARARHRVKKGSPATHPLGGQEMRALRRLKRESPASPYVFVSERGGPMSVDAFQRMLTRLGDIDTAIEVMEKALKEGRPVTEKDLGYPDDAVF